MKKLLIPAAIVASLILSGCSSVSLDEGAQGNGSNSSLQESTNTQMVNPFQDPANPLSQRSIYFAFDSYEVSPEYAPIVDAHAQWLIDHPNVSIVIQGNTDDRGGREYNLALGQKRAEAVKQRMQLLGVPASRIESVSFGEEKPAVLGDTPEAWAQNRRSDIIYPEEYIANPSN